MATYSNYAYSGYDSYTDNLFILFTILILFIIWITYSYGLAKTFEKAGFEGWIAFIPVYNQFIKYQIIFGKQKGWLFLLRYLIIFPILFPAHIIISIYTIHCLSKAYGKNFMFTIGFIFLPFIFIFFLPKYSGYLGPQPFFGWDPFDDDKKDIGPIK